MKTFKKKCPSCGEDVVWIYVNQEPQTCGSRMCETNLNYAMKHMDPLTGKTPNPEEVKKW